MQTEEKIELLPVYRIKTGKTVKLTVVADLHLDDIAFLESIYNKVMDRVARKNLKLILNGDFVSLFFLKDLSSMAERRMHTDEALDKVWEFLKKYRNRIYLVTRGNHDKRLFKYAESNFLRRYAKELKLNYADTQGVLIIQTGNREWRILVTHGWGNGRTIGAKVNKAENLARQWEQIDIVVISHTHQPFYFPISRRNPYLQTEQYHYTHIISTSAFIGDPPYVLEQAYPPPTFVVPIITLSEGGLKIEWEEIR